MERIIICQSSKQFSLQSARSGQVVFSFTKMFDLLAFCNSKLVLDSRLYPRKVSHSYVIKKKKKKETFHICPASSQLFKIT